MSVCGPSDSHAADCKAQDAGLALLQRARVPRHAVIFLAGGGLGGGGGGGDGGKGRDGGSVRGDAHRELYIGVVWYVIKTIKTKDTLWDTLVSE